MASLMRVAVRRCGRLLTANPTRQTKYFQPACLISTSKKNKDAATFTDTDTTSASDERLEDKEENWISYGWNLTDREDDAFHFNTYGFFGITLGLVGMGFIYGYMPDYNDRDWMQREAYMEIARREEEGLPFIDPNLIPPDQIELPAEEDLGDFNIVI